MQIRTYRAGVAAVVATLTTLAASSIQAAPPTPKPENSLLGIRLMARFSDVLQKFGQPTEIQVGAPSVSDKAQGAAKPGGGGMPGMPGGMPGMPSGMPGGMPGMPSSMPGGGGMPGMRPGGGGMPSGMPGMRPGGGGMPGMPSGMPGMRPGGGMPPGGRGKDGGGRGLPGFNGAPGGSSMPGGGMPPGFGNEGGMPGMPGMPGAGGANGAAQEDNAFESTWWYHYPQSGLHYAFLFNKDGRVIQIQAFGYNPKKKNVVPVLPQTAQGIRLESTLGQVLKKYGWSSDGEHVGEYVVLRYGDKKRVAFQSLKNKIVGITLGVVK